MNNYGTEFYEYLKAHIESKNGHAHIVKANGRYLVGLYFHFENTEKAVSNIRYIVCVGSVMETSKGKKIISSTIDDVSIFDNAKDAIMLYNGIIDECQKKEGVNIII